MLDFLQLRVLGHHYLLVIVVRKRKDGLHVSQTVFLLPVIPFLYRSIVPALAIFHRPYARLRHAVLAWILVVFVALWSRPEADLHLDSEQMGPTSHIRRLQLGRPCMLRTCFCIMANNDGKASQVRCTVSAHLSFPFLIELCACTGPIQGRLRHSHTSRQDRAAAATRTRLPHMLLLLLLRTCLLQKPRNDPTISDDLGRLIFSLSHAKSGFMIYFQEADLCL